MGCRRMDSYCQTYISRCGYADVSANFPDSMKNHDRHIVSEPMLLLDKPLQMQDYHLWWFLRFVVNCWSSAGHAARLDFARSLRKILN